MTVTHDPVELERQGWQALSSSASAAEEFYRRVLDDDVVMLLPGGLVLTDRGEALRSMGGPAWAAYELEDPAVLQPTADTCLVHYGVVARRAGGPDYSALVSSLYVRRSDGWRLAAHQQTPR